MTDSQPHFLETKIGIITALLALISIGLMAIGFCFIYGIYIGYGVGGINTVTEEEMVFAGFLATFLVVPEIFNTVFRLFIDGYLWAFIFLGAFIGLFLFIFAPQLTERIDEKVGGGMTWKLIVFLAIVLFPFTSFNLGKERALITVERLLTEGCTFNVDGWNSCHQIHVKEKLIYEGYMVAKSSNQLAMFNLKQNRLEIFEIPKNAKLTHNFKMPVQ